MPDWDERYRSGTHDSKEPAPLLITAVKNLTPGRALDLACGAGRHAIFLAQQGWRVTAVDASRVGIEILQQRTLAADLAIDARIADLETGEFQIEPDGYDLICDFYYLQRDLFPAIRAGVKPGGILVAAIHLSDGKADAKPHHPSFLLERDEFRALFQGREIRHYREGPSDEGGHHHDTAYLIARRPLRNGERSERNQDSCAH